MKIYDFENHFFPKELFNDLSARTECPRYDAKTKEVDYGNIARLHIGDCLFNPPMRVCDEIMDLGEFRVGKMDNTGVDTALLSAICVAEVLPREDAIKYARLCNDAVAEVMKKYPGRFMGTICLPTPYVDDAIKELERAVKELGLSYWHTHSNYGKHYLYEDMFDPLIDKCAELDVPFYIHPQSPADNYLLDSGAGFALAAFGYAVDVMKTSMRLVMKGTFDNHPNLKMILGHMAEFYPFTLGRMDDRFNIMRGLDPMLNYKESFNYYFKNKNIFMTTSGIFDESAVKLTIDNIGIDNILFGSDFPYQKLETSADFIRNLHLSDDDKEKIFYKNAEKYILKIK